MPTQRWTDAWTAPAGLPPERPPGEPGPGVLAAVHLALFFGLAAATAGAAAVAGDSEEATALSLALLFLLTGLAGLVVRRQPDPLLAWVADVLLASSVAYLFGAAGTVAHLQGASDETSALAGTLVALPCAVAAYALHRRVWTQVAAVVAAAGCLQAALQTGPDIPGAVSAAYLLILAAFLAALAQLGLARPVRSAQVLAALLGTWGAHVLAREHASLGAVVAALVLAVVVLAVLRTRNRSLLPVALIAGVAIGPAVAEPALGTADAVGLALVVAAAGGAWLAADLVRRSARPPQVGGVFAAALLLLVVGQLLPAAGDDDPMVVDALHALAIAAFFSASVAARRRPAMVVSGLILLSQLPDSTSGDEVASAVVALGGAVAAVVVARRLAIRPVGPAAAPHVQEVALAGPGREWQVVAPYPQVLDAVVAVLTAAGVPLQLVDRAAGRVVAGDPVQPLLVVAVWAQDLVRSQVRAVGAPHDVDRLESDLAGRLAQQAPNELAGPH